MSEKKNKKSTVLGFIKTHKKEIAISAASLIVGGLATYVGVKTHYRKKTRTCVPIMDMMGLVDGCGSYYYDVGGATSGLTLGDIGKLTDIVISDESFNPDVGSINTEITGVIIGVKDKVGK